MIFHTKSGSVYEVDWAQSRARALHSSSPMASTRLRRGEWRTFSSASVELGRPAIIVWTSSTPPLPSTLPIPTIPATTTSPVISIIGSLP